ncbi:putative ribonuclease H-like domain-containing protein [Tanacetum coccineum]
MVEEEPKKPVKVKRKDQGLAQIESNADAALAEKFDEIQAIIDADHELAVRLTHGEQEKYIIKERARLLVEFFERRKKQLAAERAEAIRNKPPTRTQVRNRMITYLKHMGKYTHQQLKHKNFKEVQKLYKREKKWIDDFKPIDDDSQQQAESTKKADGSSKNYKIFSEMLDDFDRQDVMDLHRLVQERNKKDEMGIVIRNKVRLVAQGYTQEEGIDYDEVFTPVAIIEAIRLFLAYASFKDFVVYQMDVKSAFLYGKIKEEVYVCQPPGFEDPDFPDRVYKVEKSLYGLHQAPRAWYETLSTYLLDNGFQREKIDKTLFIKRHKGDILLVQVYVDDIIYGSTKKELCNAFEKFTEVKTASTPMETQKPLLKDEDGEEVDVHMYRSMIGSLMYLTSSRPDIMFAVCAWARYQVNPKVSHLHAVKRIFRYLKYQPKLGLLYPKDSPFDLVAYTDSDYARASLDTKSTT